MSNYSGSDIVILEGLEAVRKTSGNVYWKYRNERASSYDMGNSR